MIVSQSVRVVLGAYNTALVMMNARYAEIKRTDEKRGKRREEEQPWWYMGKIPAYFFLKYYSDWMRYISFILVILVIFDNRWWWWCWLWWLWWLIALFLLACYVQDKVGYGSDSSSNSYIAATVARWWMGLLKWKTDELERDSIFFNFSLLHLPSFPSITVLVGCCSALSP